MLILFGLLGWAASIALFGCVVHFGSAPDPSEEVRLELPKELFERLEPMRSCGQELEGLVEEMRVRSGGEA